MTTPPQFNQDPAKQAFLHGIQKILSAKPKAIEILRIMRMYNSKLIERSSRCLKDPNPLASTMSVMSTKYPLSVDKSRFKKYQMPLNFIPPKKTDPGNKHYHGRVLCKKDAIEWRITKSPVPEESSLAVTNILMKQARKDVELYKSFNWSRVRIEWGEMILERRRARNPHSK
ncbi:unnamed protein product [Ceutorhynchus assimilis]|uniref:Uncharacterized protein n=1 Tax=Ceutorhynchus assimilis TaxID=467358 RepID=A0A9N9MJC8_9CUCU|nr:unnamed protein product [Ceutorhynchus assimilis]